MKKFFKVIFTMHLLYVPTKNDLKSFGTALMRAVPAEVLRDPAKPLKIALKSKPGAGKSALARAISESLDTPIKVHRLCSGYREASVVNAGFPLQILHVDRWAEMMCKNKNDTTTLSNIRALGGIDIIEHPDGFDVQDASLFVNIKKDLENPEAFDLLMDLRKEFGISSRLEDMQDNGPRVLYIEVKDGRLLESSQFMAFYNTLGRVYVRATAAFFGPAGFNLTNILT